MSGSKGIQLGIAQRLKAAAGVVLRGTLPFDAPTLQRFFGGGDEAGPGGSYSRIGLVYSCVKIRAEALAGMPMMVSTAADEVVESGPLAELAERPNRHMTGRAFWQATSSLLDLSGAVHWIFELEGLRRPIAVHPVAPVQMRPEKNDAGEVVRWKFRPAGRLGAQEETLGADEVYSIVDPDFEHPHDPLRGLSPRQAVATAIRQYFKADRANERSLDNDMRLGSVVSTDAPVSEDQWEDFIRMTREHNEGWDKRNRPPFVSRRVHVDPWQATFTDMEFVNLKKMSREDILSAFQVPGPVLSPFEGSNFAHANAAQEAFYQNNVLPRGARLAEEWQLGVLSRWSADRSLSVSGAQTRGLERREALGLGLRQARRAARRTSQRFYAWFDSSGVQAVQRAQLQVTEQAEKWWRMGVPLNDILNATDAPFRNQPYGDTGYKPIGLEPYGVDLLDTIHDPDGGEPEAGLLSGRRQAATEGRSRHPRRASDVPRSSARASGSGRRCGPRGANRGKRWRIRRAGG
ncbi:MAG: phage portal protein [Phycisphaeraceae bacterium]